ncbi:hypothetical protein K2173_026802 [Erythroxylum novogranatense]|uniref:Uncharacterized protein n=1 Tax=Erythroxylum novogranatense TaxID=1862640 RepID=A0AAV8TXC2_9ROSI|nr:hypothetical protein K2173_026802 [Erythroxylum novogranatense]
MRLHRLVVKKTNLGRTSKVICAGVYIYLIVKYVTHSVQKQARMQFKVVIPSKASKWLRKEMRLVKLNEGFDFLLTRDRGPTSMDPNSSPNLEEFQFDYDVDFSIMMDDGEDSFTQTFPSYQIAANLSITTEQPQPEIGLLGSSSCGSNSHAINQNLTEPAQGSSTPVMEHLETVQQDTPLFSFGSPVDLPEIMFSTMENLELSEAGNDDAELSAWMMRNLVPDTTARTSDTLVVCAALDTAALVGASSITGTIHPHDLAAKAQLQLDPVIFGGAESYSHHRNSGQRPSSSSLGVPTLRPLRAYPQTTASVEYSSHCKSHSFWKSTRPEYDND